jgi:hypothetical protein
LALDVKDPTDALHQRQPTLIHAVFYVHLFHMRHPTLGLLAALSLQAMAQPPIQLEWSVILSNSCDSTALPKISAQDGIVSWMIYDVEWTWSTQDGIVRRYLEDGTAITGYTPTYLIGCGTLDRPIDFTLRNDSLWGVSRLMNVGGDPQDVLYCADSPSGEYAPDNALNGFELHDGAYDLLVGSSTWFISAWHEVSQSELLSRIVALDLANNVLWETDLPLPQPGARRTLAMRGDTLVVAAFPELYWLDMSTGAILGSTTVYTGGMGAGRVLWNGGSFLWAAHADGLLHYGKLNDQLQPVWSSSLAGSTVNGIAQDAQGRLWIGGNVGDSGMLTRISANGGLDGTWPQNASVSDLLFHNGRLIWTGELITNETDSYLTSGTPNP